MWLRVCDRPFTTANFGAVQVSCAQLMNQFVPGHLVIARSVVMLGLVFIECTCQCMITENGGFAVRPRPTALISVSLIGGTVSRSESGSNWSLR